MPNFALAGRICVENTDSLLHAVALFKNNNFSEALKSVRKCEGTSVDAKILELRCLYQLDREELITAATAVEDSTNDRLRAKAHELLGLANYYGTNGIKHPNYKNAIEYLTKAQTTYDHSDIIEKINEKIKNENEAKKNREKEERLNTARMENEEKKLFGKRRKAYLRTTAEFPPLLSL